MLGAVLMVQGTASSVGKSMLVAALCRSFARRGVRVAPFKAQNMALNSFVTPEGHEIGRAQAVQAEAARIAPSVLMNPVLIKPEGDARSQIVLMGKPAQRMSAADYHEYKPSLRRTVSECLQQLRERYELVIIEGAGSPAEVNLRAGDIVNMDVALRANAPVLLVGDIDRGGVFASLVGTLELIEPEERALVRGFVINKFRGDVGLLTPGLEFLSGRTGKPVVGVLPFLRDLRLADEDSVALDGRMNERPPGPEELHVVVVRLPRISNYDDIAPLSYEPGVAVRFVDGPEHIAGADLVILPGSKSTVADLLWLRQRRIAMALAARARDGGPIVGICGGCQMLGLRIEDPHGVESPNPETDGLGLLQLTTRFSRDKTTAQVRANGRKGFLSPADPDELLSGYEIHMGEVRRVGSAAPAFTLRSRNGEAMSLGDGAATEEVVGTMIHGIFDNEAVRRSLLDHLRARRPVPVPRPRANRSPDSVYERLADAVEKHLDMELLDAIIATGANP